MRHIHPVETYGIKFNIRDTSISILTDTKYFPELTDFYQTDMLIISVVFKEPRPGIDHLCLADAEELINRVKPKRAILTHFGMTMLSAKPHLQAEMLTKKLGVPVEAAYDGQTVNFT